MPCVREWTRHKKLTRRYVGNSNVELFGSRGLFDIAFLINLQCICALLVAWGVFVYLLVCGVFLVLLTRLCAAWILTKLNTEYWQNNLARSVAFFIAVTAQLHWMPKACLQINFVLSVYWEYIGLGELFLNYVNYWHPLMRLRLRRQIWNSNKLSRL